MLVHFEICSKIKTRQGLRVTSGFCITRTLFAPSRFPALRNVCKYPFGFSGKHVIRTAKQQFASLSAHGPPINVLRPNLLA